ncbi:hypothetical protein KCU75_g12313, partial [Aureobasidium melanogenum]
MPPKFVPRDRKKGRIAKAKAKNSHSHDEPQDNANAAEIVPPTPSEREARRTALQAEIRAQNSTSVISGKKKKRLDKYIDTKLKKEENLALIKKLAAQKVDTSLLLSSKKLGRGGESARERLERALREKEQGINVEANDAVLFEQRKRPALELESESEDEQTSTPQANTSKPASVKASAPTPAPTSVPAAAPAPGKGGLFAAGQGLFGSGLKRPLETDEEGKPIIKSRKRTKVINKSTPVVAQEPEWEGFSGDDDDDEDDDDESEDSEDDNDDGDGESEADDDDEDVDEDDEDEEDSDEDSEEESDSDDDMEDEEDVKEAQKARSSAFKMWATEQRNQAIGFVPSTNLETVNSTTVKQPINFVPRAPSPETLPPELAVSATTESDNRPAVSLV